MLPYWQLNHRFSSPLSSMDMEMLLPAADVYVIEALLIFIKTNN